MIANRKLCREHLRLTVSVDHFAEAFPGQFVHICPEPDERLEYNTHSPNESNSCKAWAQACRAPQLRRAFSIAGLRRRDQEVEIDVIYRVVGTGTRWMESLGATDQISLLGPLGNAFPIHKTKPRAFLVAGGVGLPPMLYLAEALCDAERQTVAFCGAQSADLLALSINADAPPSTKASYATLSSVELADVNTKIVVSTDDGTMGFHGPIGQALTAFSDANPINPDELVVYTCGPERMLEYVSAFCLERNIECHVCMERAMACGTGLCQSCVVPIRDVYADDGWHYRLCCTHGPVFEASTIVWEPIEA